MRGKRAKFIMWISAPFFCAGVIVAEGKVIETANILRYMFGWGPNKVKQYCKKRKWKCEVIK